MELVGVIEKDDCLVEAYDFGLAFENRDRFDERHFASHIDLGNGTVIA